MSGRMTSIVMSVGFVTVIATSVSAQSVQYRSPAGVVYRAQADTGQIARAEAALKADPKNKDKYIALGVAQAGARQMLEAAHTFDRALHIWPNDPLLLRWRGHRYLSTRQFAKAEADLSKGARLDSTIYGNWYHLGIVRYAKGDFKGAADAFGHAQTKAPDAGELAGSTDWRWMSLMRAGKHAEAKAMIDARPDSLKLDTAYAYGRRLRLYRGELTPATLWTSDTSDVNVATLSYGLGNWYLVNGDTAKAKEQFRNAVKTSGWPGFGFIISEIELKRLKK